MEATTLYWHDYETSGLDPRTDQPLQFAGLRTDSDLNVVGEPLVVHARLTDDRLLHPQAALVNGMTPQRARTQGVNEAEFSRAIYRELAQPNSCGVGYNSIRFDDEVSRHLFYRNFLPIYEREYQHGNSRWDLLDVVRLCHDLRPEGLVWPRYANGYPDFRLESLTQANDLPHAQAHDALHDVYATVALARRIRQRQPRLFDYCFKHRTKAAVRTLIDPNSPKLLLHTSRMFLRREGATTLIWPLLWHPQNSNSVVVWDCRADPQLLLDESVEGLRALLYTPTEQLPVAATRPALKELHINKAPVIAPITTLTTDAAERLQIDPAQAERFGHWLDHHREAIHAKLGQLYADPAPVTECIDVDQQLYNDFFTPADQRLREQITYLTPQQLNEQSRLFHDPRLPELLWRYRARNYPETLTPAEQQRWQREVVQRLHTPHEVAGGRLTLVGYFKALELLIQQQGGRSEIEPLLAELRRDGERFSTTER